MKMQNYFVIIQTKTVIYKRRLYCYKIILVVDSTCCIFLFGSTVSYRLFFGILCKFLISSSVGVVVDWDSSGERKFGKGTKPVLMVVVAEGG